MLVMKHVANTGTNKNNKTLHNFAFWLTFFFAQKSTNKMERVLGMSPMSPREKTLSVKKMKRYQFFEIFQITPIHRNIKEDPTLALATLSKIPATPTTPQNHTKIVNIDLVSGTKQQQQVTKTMITPRKASPIRFSNMSLQDMLDQLSKSVNVGTVSPPPEKETRHQQEIILPDMTNTTSITPTKPVASSKYLIDEEEPKLVVETPSPPSMHHELPQTPRFVLSSPSERVTFAEQAEFKQMLHLPLQQWNQQENDIHQDEPSMQEQALDSKINQISSKMKRYEDMLQQAFGSPVVTMPQKPNTAMPPPVIKPVETQVSTPRGIVKKASPTNTPKSSAPNTPRQGKDQQVLSAREKEAMRSKALTEQVKVKKQAEKKQTLEQNQRKKQIEKNVQKLLAKSKTIVTRCVKKDATELVPRFVSSTADMRFISPPKTARQLFGSPSKKQVSPQISVTAYVAPKSEQIEVQPQVPIVVEHEVPKPIKQEVQLPVAHEHDEKPSETKVVEPALVIEDLPVSLAPIPDSTAVPVPVEPEKTVQQQGDDSSKVDAPHHTALVPSITTATITVADSLLTNSNELETTKQDIPLLTVETQTSPIRPVEVITMNTSHNEASTTSNTQMAKLLLESGAEFKKLSKNGKGAAMTRWFWCQYEKHTLFSARSSKNKPTKTCM